MELNVQKVAIHNDISQEKQIHQASWKQLIKENVATYSIDLIWILNFKKKSV